MRLIYCLIVFLLLLLATFHIFKWSHDLHCVSHRSWTTTRAGGPEIARSDPPRRPRSRSLCSQRRSSSSSRRNTLAGWSRRRNKVHGTHKRHCSHSGNTGAAFCGLTWISGCWFNFTQLNNRTRNFRGEIFVRVQPVLKLCTDTYWCIQGTWNIRCTAKSFTTICVNAENIIRH